MKWVASFSTFELLLLVGSCVNLAFCIIALVRIPFVSIHEQGALLQAAFGYFVATCVVVLLLYVHVTTENSLAVRSVRIAGILMTMLVVFGNVLTGKSFLVISGIMIGPSMLVVWLFSARARFLWAFTLFVGLWVAVLYLLQSQGRMPSTDDIAGELGSQIIILIIMVSLIYDQQRKTAQIIKVEAERLHSEAEKRRLKAEYEANVVRVSIARLLTHDLRTPMQTLLEATKYIERDPTVVTLVQDGLRNLLAQVDAHTKAMLAPPAPSATHLPTAVTQALQKMSFPPHIGLRVEDIPADYVVVPEDIVISAVQNVLSNALSFTTTTIEMQFMCDATTITLMVRDNGPGLHPKLTDIELGRSFRPGGTGQGLASIRTLLHAVNGSLTLANHPNGGAVATIALPRLHQPGSAAPALSRTTATS